LRALAVALDEAGIPYAVCGALALAIHGAPRATAGIDILARPTDLERIRDLARDLGFRFEALPIDFAAGISLRRFTKLVGPRPLPLHVLLVDDALEDLFAQRLMELDHGPG
jgi:hypothetical protein